MSYQDFLRKFSTTYPEYSTDFDNGSNSFGQFDYKYVYPNYLVVLEKLKDTKHNELRTSVVDAKYAQFRANKFVTELILNIVTFEEMHSVTSYYYSEKTFYKVGEVVVPSSYDENIENIDSFGISYFKSYEGAFYYGFPTVEFTLDVTFLSNTPCVIKRWYPNGSLQFYGQYVNNQLYGPCIWYFDRQSKDSPLIISKSGTYCLSNQKNTLYVCSGVWKHFYESGQIQKIETFDGTGVLNGYVAEYDTNGNITEYEYSPKRGRICL